MGRSDNGKHKNKWGWPYQDEFLLSVYANFVRFRCDMYFYQNVTFVYQKESPEYL